MSAVKTATSTSVVAEGLQSFTSIPSRDNKVATVCLLLEPPRCRKEVHKQPNFINKTLKQTFSQKIYFIKKVEEFELTNIYAKMLRNSAQMVTQ